ncbi:MAG: RNA polymerase sigma factor [bacterium]
MNAPKQILGQAIRPIADKWLVIKLNRGLRVAQESGDSEQLTRTYSEIWDRFHQPIYRFLYYRVGNIQVAEDLTHDTFLRVWEAVVKGTEIKHLMAFIYQVARRLIADHFRKLSVQTVSLDVTIEGEEGMIDLEVIDERLIVDAPTLLVDALERKERVMKINQAFRTLKDEYREALLLRYGHDLKVSEIAEVLDKSKNAVKVLLHRAVQTLREQINL